MTNKLCLQCNKTQPISEFSPDRRRPDKVGSCCKSCNARHSAENRKKVGYKEKYNTYKRKWLKNNPGKDQEYFFRQKYGLEIKDRENMYIQQQGCCAICGKSVPYKNVFTDHDHQTNKVRELLCVTCNTFVGYVEKYSELMNPIQKYLEKHNGRDRKD